MHVRVSMCVCLCVVKGHFWRVCSCPGLWMVLAVQHDRHFSAAGGNPRQFSLGYYFTSGVLTSRSGCVPERVSYKSVLLSV